MREVETVTDEAVREAYARLTSRFGTPFTCSIDALKTVGYNDHDAELLFQALQERYSGTSASKKTAQELKQELAEQRKVARGGRAQTLTESNRQWSW